MYGQVHNYPKHCADPQALARFPGLGIKGWNSKCSDMGLRLSENCKYASCLSSRISVARRYFNGRLSTLWSFLGVAYIIARYPRNDQGLTWSTF